MAPCIGTQDDERTMSSPSALHAGVRDLRVAAARVAREAGTADAADVPRVLDQLEDTLRDLTSACYSLGPSLALRPRSDALEDAKTTAPLAKLHEVGAAVGAAARRCRSARTALAPAVRMHRNPVLAAQISSRAG
jgi:hypothetical protein